MSFPPQGRSASTASPPQPTLLDRLKVFADWKTAVFGLILLGVGIGYWRANLVTKSEFDSARAAGTAEHASMRLETQQLRERVVRSEANLEWIRAQLAEVARVTGARPVPPPVINP